MLDPGIRHGGGSSLVRVLIAVLVLAAVAPKGARAEHGCPRGLYPGGARPNGPICVPMPGGASPLVAPDQAPPRWEERWGSVALDRTSGLYAWVVNERSKQAAQASALRDCGKQAKNCEVFFSYANQCAAIAASSKQFEMSAGMSLAEAETNAVARCATAGEACRIVHSACSMSVQVQ